MVARRFLAVPEERQRELFTAIPEPDVRVWDWQANPESRGIATIAWTPLPSVPPAELADVERRFLHARHDPASCAVYADWLDERGRVAEAAYLRTHERLREIDERDLRPIDRVLAELRALVPGTPLWWRQAIAWTRVESIEDACFALGGARLRYGLQPWVDSSRVPGALDAIEEWRLSELQREHAPLDPATFDHFIGWTIDLLRAEEGLRVVENHGRVVRDPHLVASPLGPAAVAYSISDAWNDTVMLARTREHFALFSHFLTG